MNRIELERLDGLVENLLALAGLQTAKGHERRAPVNLAEVCRRAVEELDPLAALAKVPVELEVPSELIVSGDALALQRAVRNLVENALRHTPAGEKVVVRASPHDGEARVHVIDSGVGMAPEHLPRLLERFYRIDTARNRAHGGAGLGLSIVKAIAESHDGQVEVESVVGSGSTFTIRLPLSEEITREAGAS
ncbi:MAG TPA: HAMP domain-containing sensor histidine kinase [Candidatus Acidoferrum sp.]|nr:HAMP domain-containing sensor histidine kinase [Candidatus Acidoferrum sp.]